MNRRAAGVAVLVIVLLGAVIMTRIDGIRVAGTASAPPGLSAPSVGDCALQFTAPVTVPAAGTAVPQVAAVTETGVRFAECAGERVGEVVAYRRLARQAVTENDRAADIEWCRSVASDYQAHARWRVRDAAGGVWIPSIGQQFTVVLSSVRSVASEPRWSACLVGAPGNEPYTGSYLQSFAIGAVPAPFGRCLTDRVILLEVSCAAPHDAQELGVGSGDPMSAREAVSACRDLIGVMTGMGDITADGRLRTVVTGGGPGSTEPVSCRVSVVGRNRLAATLIGIGDAPLPLN